MKEKFLQKRPKTGTIVILKTGTVNNEGTVMDHPTKDTIFVKTLYGPILEVPWRECKKAQLPNGSMTPQRALLRWKQTPAGQRIFEDSQNVGEANRLEAVFLEAFKIAKRKKK